MVSYKLVNLRNLMITLSVGSVLATAAILLALVYRFQSDDFRHTILSDNTASSHKLAESINHYFLQAQHALAWSVQNVPDATQRVNLAQEARRLYQQSQLFNRVAVVNEQNVIDAIFPAMPGDNHKPLKSPGSLRALQSRQPLISLPYISTANNFVVLLSYPLSSPQGLPVGYLAGVIYLHKDSELNRLLKSYHYTEGNHVRIETPQGTVIYDSSRNPEDTSALLDEPSLSERLLKSASGSFEGEIHHQTALISYSTVNSTGWKVVIYSRQTAVKAMMASSISLSAGVIFPVIVLISLTAGYLASRISTPLTRLARVTEKFPTDEKLKNILNINVWYYEAKILRKAVYKSLRAMQYTVSRLNNDAMTDQLTDLYNRRGLVEKMRDLPSGNNIIIMLDIDNFKHINDRYGHDTGDRTLVALAKRLKNLCRSSDIISRFGGEEFVVVLPGCPFDTGVTIAERIRFGVSGYHDESIPVFTVSVGVYGVTEAADIPADQAIKLADIALYAAKEAGRNCVVTNHQGQLRRYPQGNLLVQPPRDVVAEKAASKI